MGSVNFEDDSEWEKFLQGISSSDPDKIPLDVSCFGNDWDPDPKTWGDVPDLDQWLDPSHFLDGSGIDQHAIPFSSDTPPSDQDGLAAEQSLQRLRDRMTRSDVSEAELQSKVAAL